MPHILIIDDDEAFRTTLAESLRADGHRVTTAADGVEGAQLFRASPADLLLVDMIMPQSGLALIRVLRSQFPGIKVIAMSGRGTHRLGYARDLGACRTLSKPFTGSELTSAITAALAPASPEPPPSPKPD